MMWHGSECLSSDFALLSHTIGHKLLLVMSQIVIIIMHLGSPSSSLHII